MLKTVSSLDNVRIEIPGAGAVTIPALLILATNKVLRHCSQTGVALDVDRVEGGWQATLDMGQGACGEVADTPWAAISFLAEELE